MNKIIKIVLISIILFTITLFLSGKLFLDETQLSFIERNYKEIGKIFSLNHLNREFRNIDVLQYDIQIDINVNDKSIKEIAKIVLIKNKKDSSDISLDLYDGFNIEAVNINNIKAEYIYENNKILIPQKNFANDTITVGIIFNGIPQNLGFGSFNIEKLNGRTFISTLNEPLYAHTWFPCNDTPSDKALMKISVTSDSSLVSISNGVLIDVKTSGEKRTYYWSTHYPIATYSVAVYSGEYQMFTQMYRSNNDSMNIEYYVTKEKLADAEKDFLNHPEYLTVFSNLFGKYPFWEEKYGVAEIVWQQGAMETQTITGLGSNFISGHGFNKSILIHELAHHWWGNSVTPKSWKDVWLNEGFATYSEALYYEAVSGKRALTSTMHSFALKVDSESNTTLYNPGVNLFSDNVYNKGAWVLHMLRKEIGDSLFFTGLKHYYDKFKYKNVSTNDLKDFFEIYSGKDLDKFFNQWVFKGTGIPELNVSWNGKYKNSASYLLKIKIEQNQSGYENYCFPLDIEIKDNSGVTYKYYPVINGDTTLTYSIKERVKKIELDKDNWLLAKIIIN